jgi:2-oxoglutarate ferredoxin oxidoreductase subunit beta
MKSLIRSIDRLRLQKDDVCIIPGIGCSSRLTGYMDFNTLHTTHGRPIAFASGVKLAKPSLSVIVVTGDGDALAIGGNHFLHAARRNMDLTVLLFNNAMYGITDEQLAPTTPIGRLASTAGHGSIDPPFDACQLAIGVGATYVARGTAYHTQQLDRLIEGGIKHKGFALIEILENCNTYYGRANQIGLLELLQWEKNNTVNVKAAERMTPEQLQGKILTGLLHQPDRGEHFAHDEQLIGRAPSGARAEI